MERARPRPTLSALTIAVPGVLRPPLHLVALAGVLAIAIGLRIAWISAYNIDPLDGRFDDSVFYQRVAFSLADGRGYVDPWGRGPTAQWPPAYPATLAAMYVLFGQELAVAKALNVLLAALSMVLAYLLVERLFNRRVALWAALLLAVYPTAVYFSTLVMAENLFLPAVLLALLVLATWTGRGRQPTAPASLALGAAIAFAALTRVEGIWLLLPALVLWWVASSGWQRRVRNALLVLAGCAALLAPWTVRNAIELDRFVPLRQASVRNFGVGLNPDYKDYRGLPADAPRPSIQESIERYVDDPGLLPQFVWDKLQDLYETDATVVRWVRGSYRNPALTPEEVHRWRTFSEAAYRGTGVVAAVGMVWAVIGGHRRAVALFGSFALTWTVGFSLLVPNGRYHFVLVPAIVAFAALVIDRFARGPAASSRAAWAPPLAALLTLGGGAAFAAMTLRAL